MRIGFVYSEMEALGIQYLSSYLKQHGHSTRLFFDPLLFMDTATQSSFLGRIFDYSKKLRTQIDEFQPDVLAFSVLTTNFDWVCKMAKELKESTNIPIVFGGIHPTLDPDSVLEKEFVDYVIVGEGEEALLELVENINNPSQRYKIKNVYAKNNGVVVKNPLRPLIEDLDSLPFPDKDMFYDIMPYTSKYYMIMTSRGCPYACTFCCNDSLRKISGSNQRYLRRRSSQNVLSELDWANKKYSLKYIFFDDSTFTYDKKWLKEFSQLYKDNIGVPCFCWVHPSEIDEETIKYLKRMNCRAVEMGVESLNPDIRKKWLNRHYTNEQVEYALQLLKKNRIFCVTDNIIGLPDETIEDLEYMVEFYNKTRPGKIYVFELRPFPNTKLADLMKNKNNDNSNREGLFPFTLYTFENKQFKKIILLTLSIYVFPKKIVSFLVKKKIYRFFPTFFMYNSLSNLLEIMPFIVNLFAIKKFWFPIRRFRERYLHFSIKMLIDFFKRK